jgi:CBS domain-containing protein
MNRRDRAANMHHVRVADLMSTEVVTVAPETTLKEVADVLVEHGIAGVPVCDAEGKVVGVVSESDILWREVRSLSEGGGLIDCLLDAGYGDDKRTKAKTAGEAMSAPAITIEPDVPVARAARLMLEHMINRVPVVSDGRLVGVLTRGDLVRVFRRPDEQIEREIREDVLRETLCVDPESLWIAVNDGDVVIGGEVENRSTAVSIEKHVLRVPGVTGLDSELRWQIDDRAHRTAVGADHLPPRI